MTFENSPVFVTSGLSRRALKGREELRPLSSGLLAWHVSVKAIEEGRVDRSRGAPARLPIRTARTENDPDAERETWRSCSRPCGSSVRGRGVISGDFGGGFSAAAMVELGWSPRLAVRVELANFIPDRGHHDDR